MLRSMLDGSDAVFSDVVCDDWRLSAGFNGNVSVFYLESNNEEVLLETRLLNSMHQDIHNQTQRHSKKTSYMNSP